MYMCTCMSVPLTKHYSCQCNIYNLLYFYEIFRIFKVKWITYAFSTASPGWFSWKFSLPFGRYTDISITNCNTVYITSYIHSSIHWSIHLCIHLSFIYPSTHPSIHLSIHLPSLHLSIHSSIYPLSFHSYLYICRRLDSYTESKGYVYFGVVS